MPKASRCLALAASLILSAAVAPAAEKKVQLKDLPDAVQKTVHRETQGATSMGIQRESDSGRVVFELETKRNGRSRDLLIDEAGQIVEVEEEVDPAMLPAPVRAALEKAAAGGTIKKIEAVTRGKVVTYDATVSKGGKTLEVGVTSDGVVKGQ